MPTFKCWCGHLIREASAPANCGHVLWDADNVSQFYDEIAVKLLSYLRAESAGGAPAWIRENFDHTIAPYEMPAEDVSATIVHQIAHRYASGIYHCPKCNRIHLQIRGTENRWESFLPEGRISGDK